MPAIPSPVRTGTPRRAPTTPQKLGILGIALAMMLIAFFLAPSRTQDAFTQASTTWKGYRLLLVESSIAESEVLDRLKTAGIWPVISESTQPVALSDWSHTVMTTLAEARHILIRDDPRLDTYIERLYSYFTAQREDSKYRVFYIPESRSQNVSLISKALSGLETAFILPESALSSTVPTKPFFSFILAVTILLAAAFSDSFLQRTSHTNPGRRALCTSRRRLESFFVRLILAFPFIVLASKGGWTSFVAALWALSLFDAAGTVESFLRELDRLQGLRRALIEALRKNPPGISVCITAFIASLLNISVLPSLLAALGSSSALVWTLAAAKVLSMTGFEPLAILPRRRPASFPGALRAGFACITILAALLVTSRDGSTKPSSFSDASLVIPLPSALAGSTMPLPEETRSRLRTEAADGNLPGLASYLAHMALQESIPYSRIGEERKNVFETVTLPTRDGNDTRIVFDDAWARSVYRSIEAVSIEKMLAVQGRAVTGKKAGMSQVDFKAAQNSSPLAPIHTLLYILLMVPPLLRIAALRSISRAVSSRGIRQEA